MMLLRQLSLKSRPAVRQLGFRVAVVCGTAAAIPGAHLRHLMFLSTAVALYAAGEALKAKQRPWADIITHWDEAAAFAVLSAVVARVL